MKKNHFGAAIIALFAILLSVFVFSCKGETNPVNVYYTITYESAHGTAPESKKVLSGTILAIQDLPTLTAAGYNFEGWYIGSSKITPELNYTVNSNIKLTAKWTEVSVTPPAPAPVYYTVTYVTERGQAPSSKRVLSGTALTAADLPDLTADGYAFEGWYIGSTKITAGYEVSGNITLTAKWKLDLPPVQCTITYVSAYGQAPQSKSVLSGSVLTAADLPTLSADDEVFGGWYIGSTKIEVGFEVTTSITLTANWSEQPPAPVAFTVSYQTAQGTAPAAKIVQEQTVLTASDLPDLTANGYKFEGWYLNNQKITADSQYKVLADITLVAMWTQMYTITYSSQYGEVPESKTLPAGKNLSESDLPVLTANGYTFDGWYIGTTKITAGYAVNDNITLTATWLKTYTLSYSTERGTAPGSKTFVAGATLASGDLPALTATGYTFDGWYSGSTKITEASNYKVNADTTLVGKWNYTISYSTEYGASPTSKTVLSGYKLTQSDLPVLSDNDYIFIGWKINSVPANVSYAVNDNITLTAAWTPVQTSESGFRLLVTSDTDITEDELNFALTAQKSGDSYILTATQGYDLYLWSVDGMYDDCGYDWDELHSSLTQLNEGNVPSVFVPNTLTFTEDNLPEDVAPDGTYVVYVQAFKKYRPNEYSSYRYKRIGLAFTVIKM